MKIQLPIKTILSVVGLVLISLSCTRDNYLDFQPKGVIIPSKVEDYRRLLDLIDGVSFSDRNLIGGFGNRPLRTEFVTDGYILSNGIISAFGFGQSEIRTYLFEDEPFSNQDEDSSWGTYYEQIYAANLILDGLANLTDGTPEEIAALAAEAKLHRAFAYFDLVNHYGLHYSPSSATTDLGVPIREGILFENVDFTRVSVQATYDYIINDILEALPNLVDTQQGELFFRPSKVAAYGFLSKVYLYQGRYADALDAVENSLALKNDLRNINDDPEFFENSAIIKVFPGYLEDPEIVWHKLSFTTLIVDEAFVDMLYEGDDLRSEWFATIRDFFGFDIDGVYYGADSSNFQKANGINTPDLYLVRAECNARLGNVAAANSDLNTLRQNRFATGKYVPVNISDADDLLIFIKNERRRELVGNLERMFDIKRYNQFDNANISLTHTIGNRTETLPANSKNWALPIAQSIVQLNPEIEQNPRD